MAPRHQLAQQHLVGAYLVAAGRAQGLGQQPGDQVELHAIARAALEHAAVQKTRSGKEAHHPRRVAIDEHVLPGHEHVVEDEDRVVLVEARRQRVIERRAIARRRRLVGCPADQLQARRVYRHHEHQGEVEVLGRRLRRLAHEIVVGERRRRRHDLGAGDVDAGRRLLLHARVDVLHRLRRQVPVDRRIDQRVVHERHRLLGAHVPAPRVLGVGAVIVGHGAQRVREGRLVVGRAAHPAVGQARPAGDCLLRADQILARPRHAEITMGVAARSGVGGTGEQVLGRGIVQRIVEPCDRAHCIAERRMGSDVGHPLAVDVDRAAVAQARHVLDPGERALAIGNEVFRFFHGSPIPSPAASGRRLAGIPNSPATEGERPMTVIDSQIHAYEAKHAQAALAHGAELAAACHRG